jgi:exosome complex component RRP45
MDGSITFALNSHRELCALHKPGGCAMTVDQLLRCAHAAATKVEHVTKQLQAALADGERRANERRLAFRPESMSKMPTSHLLMAIQKQQAAKLGKNSTTTEIGNVGEHEYSAPEPTPVKMTSMAEPNVGATSLSDRWKDLKPEDEQQEAAPASADKGKESTEPVDTTRNEVRPPNVSVDSDAMAIDADKDVEASGLKEAQGQAEGRVEAGVESDSDVDLMAAVKKKKKKKKAKRKRL